MLKYKCDDCWDSLYRTKTIYQFSQTSENVTVSGGARYTVMIRVYTRYGYGNWAQTTTTIISHLGPVNNLNAKLDSSKEKLVHLSWEAPSEAGFLQVRTMPRGILRYTSKLC